MIVAAAPIARGAERDIHVDRIDGDDRRDRVVKVQIARPDDRAKRVAERVAGEVFRPR